MKITNIAGRACKKDDDDTFNHSFLGHRYDVANERQRSRRSSIKAVLINRRSRHLIDRRKNNENARTDVFSRAQCSSMQRTHSRPALLRSFTFTLRMGASAMIIVHYCHQLQLNSTELYCNIFVAEQLNS